MIEYGWSADSFGSGGTLGYHCVIQRHGQDVLVFTNGAPSGAYYARRCELPPETVFNLLEDLKGDGHAAGPREVRKADWDYLAAYTPDLDRVAKQKIVEHRLRDDPLSDHDLTQQEWDRRIEDIVGRRRTPQAIDAAERQLRGEGLDVRVPLNLAEIGYTLFRLAGGGALTQLSDFKEGALNRAWADYLENRPKYGAEGPARTDVYRKPSSQQYRPDS